jgi:uncharacterized beta-barrel protein YwiB (DUF1934 family)
MIRTRTIPKNYTEFLFKKEKKEVSLGLSMTEIPMKINVKTTIHQLGGKEVYELAVFGRYLEKDGASFLKYEEVQDEGSIRTIVKVSGDEALILRGGAVKMRLPFRLHKKLRGSYEMPFGTFEIITLAKRIDHSDGLIDILYDFTMQGKPAGTYHLEITFQEDKNEHS